MHANLFAMSDTVSENDTAIAAPTAGAVKDFGAYESLAMLLVTEMHAAAAGSGRAVSLEMQEVEHSTHLQLRLGALQLSAVAPSEELHQALQQH